MRQAVNETWPALPLDDWEPTYLTLHRWTQVVGKVRLACAPLVNHWWNVPLYVTPRGLTTSAMPHDDRLFSIDFDFIDHRLVIRASDGAERSIRLEPMSVAAFYAAVMRELAELGLGIEVWPMPVEIEKPVAFPEDQANASYDSDAVARLHRVLVGVQRVFEVFRGRFLGKSSPVHFFWGAFDLAVTRFNGDRNPSPPDDPVMREGYSHAVISHGFWPGGDWPNGGRVDQPVFYAYAAPEPDGFREASVEPGPAGYREKLGEYLLSYEDVRASDDPEGAILAFLQSTYEAGAEAAGWDRAALER